MSEMESEEFREMVVEMNAKRIQAAQRDIAGFSPSSEGGYELVTIRC